VTLPRSVGRWEVVRELGRGGMGRVLEVRDPDADRLLALKLLDARAAGAEGALRFQREAELMARVRHPNVVRVHEVGHAQGAPFFVCEKVEGQPLDALLAGGPLAPAVAARLVRALADGLVACHAQGIVHRDLKPANVIVRPDGSPVLLDFGVARDEQARSLTETGVLMGTPVFMSPEQAEGHRVDARTDVYGLGATLFCCLAGRPPFDHGGSLQASVKRVLFDEPAWPPAPSGLLALLRRAMAKRPDDRHADMAALEDDLDRWLASGEERASASTRRGALAALALASVAALGVLAASSGASDQAGPPSRPEPRVAPTTTTTASDDAPAARADALVARARAERAARPSRGRRVATLEPPGEGVRGTTVRAVLLAGGQVVAGLTDGRVVVWPGLGDPGREVPWPEGVARASVTAITSFGRSRALVGTRSGALLLVDAASGAAEGLALPDGPAGATVEALAADEARGLLALSRHSGWDGVSGARDPAVSLWSRDAGGGWRLARSLPLAASAQGITLTPWAAEVVIAFGQGTDDELGHGVTWLGLEGASRTWKLPRGYPRAVAWLPDGRLAVGTTVGQVQLVPPGARGFDVEADRVLPMEGDLARRSHLEGVLLVAVAGSRLASSSWDGAGAGGVKVWDTATHTLRLALPSEVTGIKQLSFSGDGELLLVSGGGLLQVWDLEGL
jgi:hypothetical protein